MKDTNSECRKGGAQSNWKYTTKKWDLSTKIKISLTSVGRRVYLERSAERSSIGKALFPRLTDGCINVCGIIL